MASFGLDRLGIHIARAFLFFFFFCGGAGVWFVASENLMFKPLY